MTTLGTRLNIGSLPGRWVRLAACNGLDSELFFPTKGEAAEAAKAVCALCPVRLPCLNHALINNEKFGVWGGFSYKERRLIRRARSNVA